MSLVVETKPERVSFTFSPSSASESEALQTVSKFLDQWHDENVVAPSIVFHKLLQNAIQYGNQDLPEGKVHCGIERLFACHYRIDIEDEGLGIDYRKLGLYPPDDPRRLPQREYLIVGALCERLEFNEAGNRISVYLCTEDTK